MDKVVFWGLWYRLHKRVTSIAGDFQAIILTDDESRRGDKPFSFSNWELQRRLPEFSCRIWSPEFSYPSF
jgi:hypothetical protein